MRHADRTCRAVATGAGARGLIATGRGTMPAAPVRGVSAARPRHGFSLVELMVVLTILAILVAAAIPSFRRSIEQSHADIAVANLRAIWTAERVYWLQNDHVFTDSLSALESSDLIDPTIVAASEPRDEPYYAYSLTAAADGTTFTATARRSGSSTWSDSFTITEAGVVEGSVNSTRGETIRPSFKE